VPAELADLESRVRASLIEAIVVADDSLTERTRGDVPTIEELEPALAELMIEGRIVPVRAARPPADRRRSSRHAAR